MPYPNEHACRINEPGKYEKFARKNGERTVDEKPIDVIYGITKDGKSEVQALRFPKEQWKPDDAKSYCDKEKGRFEPAKMSYVGLFRETLVCEEIFVGKVKSILFPEKNEIDLNEVYVLTDNEFIYGLLTMKEPEKVTNKAHFKRLKESLRVSEDEYTRISLFGEVLCYQFEFEAFEEPISVIKDVSTRFTFNEPEKYKASILSDNELKKDWNYLLTLYTESKRNKESKETFDNLETIAYELLHELTKRSIDVVATDYNLWSRRLYEKTLNKLREKKYNSIFEEDCKCGCHIEPEDKGWDFKYYLRDINIPKPYIYIDTKDPNVVEFDFTGNIQDPVTEWKLLSLFPEKYHERITFRYIPNESPTLFGESYKAYFQTLSFVDKITTRKTLEYSSLEELQIHGETKLYDNVLNTTNSTSFTNTTSDYLEVTGILFRPGKIKGDNFIEDQLMKAKLVPLEGRRICYVNLHHVRNEDQRIGVLKRIWYDKDYEWVETGTKKLRKGALLFQATITDKETVDKILNTKFWTVSAELNFELDNNGTALNIEVCGMAFTPCPAVQEACLSKICNQDGECKDVTNPLI